MTVAGDDFRGLGFNPLPGDPEVIKALECDAREFGRRMIEQADFLGKVAHRDGWQGEAAKVFSQHVETLPKDLHKLGSAFLSLSGAIEKYHARFLLEKGKAKALEQQAVAARQKLSSAQFAYDAPVISAPDTCLPPRDRAAVDTAEDELGAILREAHAFAERFDCSPEVQGLAKAIREFAKNAPDEPRWNIIKRWAGDVFSITPVGAALNAAHDLINQYAEFFNDLAQLLSDLSGTLGILSLPLMFVPPMGTALGCSSLGSNRRISRPQDVPLRWSRPGRQRKPLRQRREPREVLRRRGHQCCRNRRRRRSHQGHQRRGQRSQSRRNRCTHR